MNYASTKLDGVVNFGSRERQCVQSWNAVQKKGEAVVEHDITDIEVVILANKSLRRVVFEEGIISTSTTEYITYLNS